MRLWISDFGVDVGTRLLDKECCLAISVNKVGCSQKAINHFNRPQWCTLREIQDEEKQVAQCHKSLSHPQQCILREIQDGNK